MAPSQQDKVGVFLNSLIGILQIIKYLKILLSVMTDRSWLSKCGLRITKYGVAQSCFWYTFHKISINGTNFLRINYQPMAYPPSLISREQTSSINTIYILFRNASPTKNILSMPLYLRQREMLQFPEVQIKDNWFPFSLVHCRCWAPRLNMIASGPVFYW